MPIRATALLLLFVAAMTSALAQTATPAHTGVRGTLDPRRITLGGQAAFTLETTGAPANSLPRAITADGLVIEYGGHNSSIQIINGQRAESYSYVYSVRPSRVGRFTIPAVEVAVGGTVFTTEPQDLVVEAPSDDLAVNRARSPYFLELETPKTEIYVGEIMPLKLTLYVIGRNTISGVGQPEMERENLVMKRFPTSPQSGAIDIDGSIYSTITLETSLFAIDAGEITVGPCSIPAMYYESQEYAKVPSIFRRANRATFTSNTFKLKVKPLPETGKPEDFTGAVGTFELTQTASPTTLEAGDPISIDLHLSGVGNFDRLEAPAMIDTEGWQLYPARELVQNLSDGITGGKVTYSLVAIPLEPHREIPPFRFSYFDPRQEKYITAMSDPVAIKVAPDASAGALEASAERPGMPADYSRLPAGQPIPGYEDILTIIAEPPFFRTVTTPLLRSPLFWAANAIPALAFLGLIGTSAHRRWRVWQLERRADPSPRTPGEILAAMRAPDITRRDFYRETLTFIDATERRDDARLTALESAALALLYASKLSNATAPITPTESKAILEILEQVNSTEAKGKRQGGSSRTSAASLSCIILLILTSTNFVNAAEDPANLYHSASAAYEKGDFQTAHDTWLSIVDNHGIAADLFYNLGNASYRLAKPGEAALWYQRALVIDPSHTESSQNLKVIEGQVGYMNLEWNFLQKFADRLTLRQLIIGAAIGFWALALSLALGSCLPNLRRRPLNLTARVLGITLLTFSLTTLLIRRSPESLRERSIVIALNATARTAPADDSKEVISLPPGTQVNRVAQRASWSYVAIPGDLRGWIHTEEAAPLWPFDASFLR